MHTHKRILIFCVFLFLSPVAASAATVSLKATPERIGIGDIVRVDILINSAMPVNAFSGAVSYSETMLETVAVSDGNSVINLWITHPAAPSAGMPIAFAGITPGGFSGTGGTLFSVLFRAKATGTANMALADVEVLRNDGEGGEEPVTLKPLALSIGPRPLGGYAEPSDTTSPESFTAYLGNDPQLFGGRNYLVFIAVDKDSGIDHYAVAESRLPPFLHFLFPLFWNITEAPYVIADQNLTSTLYVKAVDRAGNERLGIYPPRHLFTAYEIVVLLVILLGVVLFWQRGRGRRFKRKL